MLFLRWDYLAASDILARFSFTIFWQLKDKMLLEVKRHWVMEVSMKLLIISDSSMLSSSRRDLKRKGV